MMASAVHSRGQMWATRLRFYSGTEPLQIPHICPPQIHDGVSVSLPRANMGHPAAFLLGNGAPNYPTFARPKFMMASAVHSRGQIWATRLRFYSETEPLKLPHI